MNPAPLYLQLWSLRHQTSTDPEGALRSVRSLGFDGVELAGDYGWTADRWRALLDETRLTAVSAHIGLEALETELSVRLNFCRALGMSRVVVPSLRNELHTLAGFHEAARRLNALGHKMSQEGLSLGYHNHAFEFAALDPATGPCGMEILLAETDPSVVGFEFDTFWIERGGRDAVAFIRRHESRVCFIHAKDLRKHDNTEMPSGQGDVDFETLVPICAANGWPIIVEYEGADAPEAVRQGAAFLRPLLG